MFGDRGRSRLYRMQLIQIGVVKQKTVLDLVLEMAARQTAEIDQLKMSASARSREKRDRQVSPRCRASKRAA
jgi:hypothetical protein